MSLLAVLLSMSLGVLWHTVVFVLMGRPLGDAISSFPGMLAGAMAGLCAGYLTLLSRMRHQGRESILEGVLTYYAAAVIYSLVSMLIGANTGVTHLSGSELLSSLVGGLWITVTTASVGGVILIPLCFATRFLFWKMSRRRSNVVGASVATTIPRSRGEQTLFWIAWLLGPGLIIVSGSLANPWSGGIWTPDAEPWTVRWFGTVYAAGCALSALSTLAVCVLRGSPQRQPESWLLLLFWLLFGVLAVTRGGDVLVLLTCIAGGLALWVAVARWIPTPPDTTPEP